MEEIHHTESTKRIPHLSHIQRKLFVFGTKKEAIDAQVLFRANAIAHAGIILMEAEGSSIMRVSSR